MSVDLTPGPNGEEWHCPRDDAWFPASSWTVEVEDDPGHRESWHNCPRGHGFPGRTPYTFPEAVTAARTEEGAPIEPPARSECTEEGVDGLTLWEENTRDWERYTKGLS